MTLNERFVGGNPRVLLLLFCFNLFCRYLSKYDAKKRKNFDAVDQKPNPPHPKKKKNIFLPKKIKSLISGCGAGKKQSTVCNHGIHFKDDKQRSRYKSLISKHISACRYLDTNAMDILEIEEHVIRLLNSQPCA